MQAQDEPIEDGRAQDDQSPRGRRLPGKLIMSGIALLGVGAIAGGVASTAVSASAATTTTTAASGTAGSSGSSSSSVPGSGRQRPGAPPGDTALPLHGTITALGSASVTIKTSSGTTTYAVTSSSDIEKSGKAAGLSGLAVGDNVAFSTATTDGTTSIDTLVAGNATSGMAGGCGRGPGGPGSGQGTPPNGSSGTGTSGGTSSSESSA
jgi:hypothetical protein